MKILIELEVGDALQAGLSMISLVKCGYLREPGTAAMYERVGKVLATAAREAAPMIGLPAGTPPLGIGRVPR